MIGEYNKSVILTYVGIVSAIIGVFCAVNMQIDEAFLCLIASGVCDLFDGAIARKCKRTERAKQFGVQLDSLADVISFLAFPCVLAFCVMGTLGFVSIFYVIAGVIRLAWFNITANSTEQNGETLTYFQGLPVTYSALILPFFYLLTLIFPAVLSASLFAVLYLAMSAAFVVDVKIKKPRGVAYIIFALLAIFVTIGIVLF